MKQKKRYDRHLIEFGNKIVIENIIEPNKEESCGGRDFPIGIYR